MSGRIMYEIVFSWDEASDQAISEVCYYPVYKRMFSSGFEEAVDVNKVHCLAKFFGLYIYGSVMNAPVPFRLFNYSCLLALIEAGMVGVDFNRTMQAPKPEIVHRVIFNSMDVDLNWRYVVPLLHAGPNLSNMPRRYRALEYNTTELNSIFAEGIRAYDHLVEMRCTPQQWLLAIFRLAKASYLVGIQYYNPYRKRMRHLVHFRRAADARRDSGMVFQAASEGRPLELAKRLVLGRLAGGHTRAGTPAACKQVQVGDTSTDGRAGAALDSTFNALTAACVGGHGKCVWVLARGVRGADRYMKSRDPGGRGCWEVAEGSALEVLEEIRNHPWMLCEDLPRRSEHSSRGSQCCTIS